MLKLGVCGRFQSPCQAGAWRSQTPRHPRWASQRCLRLAIVFKVNNSVHKAGKTRCLSTGPGLDAELFSSRLKTQGRLPTRAFWSQALVTKEDLDSFHKPTGLYYYDLFIKIRTLERKGQLKTAPAPPYVQPWGALLSVKNVQAITFHPGKIKTPIAMLAGRQAAMGAKVLREEGGRRARSTQADRRWRFHHDACE